MRKFIAATTAAAVCTLAGMCISAAPAQAGNFDRDFYLKGSCVAEISGSPWAEVSATNYDNNLAQTYHLNAYGYPSNLTINVYVDGVRKTGKGESYAYASDHGPHTIRLTAKTTDGKTGSCAFSL